MAWRKAWVEQEGVTVKGSSHFNPDPDVQTLYNATKGIDTSKQAVIDGLTRSNAQRPQITQSFKAHFGKGLGTKEGVIIEILASRTKSQLREIMKAYEEEEDIQADTSGYLKRILVGLLQGSWDDISSFVDPALALQDAQDLYVAGEKIRGTDEMKFTTILTTQSATHLMRVFEEYKKIANKTIEDSIKSETDGSLEEAMLTIVKCTQNLHSYFVEWLYCALTGIGTRVKTLIRNIVSRSEIDLNLIKSQFKKIYGKTLSSMIAGDTSGDCKNALLTLVGSDP